MITFQTDGKCRWVVIFFAGIAVNGCGGAGGSGRNDDSNRGWAVSLPTDVPASMSRGFTNSNEAATRSEPRPSLPSKGRIDDQLCQHDISRIDRLTLGQAIARTICSNPSVVEAYHAAKAEVSQYESTISLFLPTVSLSTQRARNSSHTVSFGISNTALVIGNSYSFAVNWLLLDFGGRKAQMDAAERTALAAMASKDTVIQAAISVAAEAFLNALAAADMRLVAERSLKAAQSTLVIAEARFASGSGTSVDAEFARLGIEQAKVAAARAIEQMTVAKGDLAAIMNLAPDTPLTLSPRLGAGEPDTRSVTLSNDIKALLLELEAHGEIRAAQSRAAAAELQIEAAKSELFPKVSAVANYNFGGRPGASVAAPGTSERYFGLTLSIPISGVVTDYLKVRTAVSQHQRAVAQVDGARRKVQSSFWKAYQAVVSSNVILGSAIQAERHAKEAEAQAGSRYRIGAADLSELLRAQKARTDAEVEIVKARLEMQLSRIRVLLSLGRIAPWRLGSRPLPPSRSAVTDQAAR